MSPSERPTAHREDVPDEILTEILARLPLRSISRFKTVCRRWKSAVESVYFRGLFVSVHQNSSCGWSLVCQGRELFNFHGCETWGLPKKSIACYLEEMMADDGGVDLYLGAFSFSGLVLVKGANDGTYVGNPVLREWVVIPPLPYRYPCIPFGLVTPHGRQRRRCSGIQSGLLGCSGTLERQILHFCDDDDLCRSILLPNHNPGDLKGALTASCGTVMYIKTSSSLGDDNLLKVWRLNNDDDDSWQLLWDIRLQFFHDIRFYVPISMHPYDPNLVYLWSQKNRFLVSCNLKTQNYRNLRDDTNHQGFYLNQSLCEEYMRGSNRSVLNDDLPRNLLQLVLPRWMDSMPVPPQLEMMDTTSLLAYIASLPKRK
ncbi:hypothetical protein Bca101_014174 [Brassica carinata]